MIEWKEIAALSGGSALLALLTGRTFRRILIWPFQWIASRTRTKKDDQLITDAKADLGLPPEEGKE